MENQQAIEELKCFVADSVKNARSGESPFYHLKFERVFPENIYERMLEAMPVGTEYRRMSGQSRGHKLADGTPTRIKIDLFPEYIRHMPKGKQEVWGQVGQALCSREVRQAFIERLAPGLERRFGNAYKKVGMFSIPILTRDIAGYRITPHTDVHWKGITVQLYLPPDDTIKHVGTIFHEKQSDGTMKRITQMPFARNSGYAFAVGDNTWHSADLVGQEVKCRDSILLTYFVDQGVMRILRNRGKRFGNFVLNEARSFRK